ncbi:response regulator [Alkalimarinus sediminis]|uniref:histidine kinase n=1 Tax=Alkalimarinus sediminis TaxID=1632866 RepID=A0A9E8HJZ7_9ALTE|nr:response regulator [Alkalimarinus sediminis]UZW75542.1 response regulator [Alkalimarinus sediminis]
MRKWGVKTRVMVLALFPAITIALILGVVFTHTQISSIQNLLHERGLSLGRQLATASEYGVFTSNRPLLLSLTNATLEEKDVRSIMILDSFHRSLVHSGPKMLSVINPVKLPTDRVVIDETKDSTLFITPIKLQTPVVDELQEIDPPLHINSESKDIVGWVALELSHANSTVAKYQTLMTSSLIIIVGILINWLIAIRMTRGVIRPIQEVTRAVTEIKEGKLDTRVYSGGGEELQLLEAGINSMAETLSKAHNEMQHNIDQATEDLRETLETIEIQNIELDIARKEALEASRIKSEFLANMSHEIRTPLNGILGFTNLLMKGHLSQHQKDHLTTIKKSSEILLTIINDILDFSKIEAGKLILDRTPLKLREIIEDVMTMLAPTAHSKGLDLVPLIYSDVPNNILGDPLRIKQIITNLVNNAIKFTQSGEVVLRAMLEAQKDNSITVKISVSDTGVGLSRVQQQSLFNAFAQADASTARQYGGTGLGLVISKRLIEEMGGEIGLESELGKGSIFWFTLATEIASNASPDPKLEALSGERIIYMENQATTGLAVQHMLSNLGVHVKQVDSPVALIKGVIAAQEQRKGYAAAIVGINRHLMASNQYKQLLSELEYNRGCRTLLLTPTLDHHQHSILDMVSAHLTKPVIYHRLYSTLLKLINGDVVEPKLSGPYTEDQFTDPTTLPLQEIPALSAPDHASSESTSVPTILAVDDNDANLKLVEVLIKELGINVVTAASGFEALTKWKLQKFDLIFMDVQMPGMDGIETTEKIRGHEKNGQRIPIVALTAHALAEEKKTLLNKGFDDYLTKPISEQQLQDVIFHRTGYQCTNQNQTDTYDPTPQPIKPSTRARKATCVDIALCIKLAAGKNDLAEELFSMLLEHLVSDIEAIQTFYEDGDHEALLERVHKLHGATRYCGVPELQETAERMETSLKRKTNDLEEHYQDLIEAIEQVQRWADYNNWQNALREFNTHKTTH